jgi:hypothetical protein
MLSLIVSATYCRHLAYLLTSTSGVLGIDFNTIEGGHSPFLDNYPGVQCVPYHMHPFSLSRA